MQRFMTGEIVFVEFCHLRKSFGTYEQCFMEQFFILAMFVNLYGIAPRDIKAGKHVSDF